MKVTFQASIQLQLQPQSYFPLSVLCEQNSNKRELKKDLWQVRVSKLTVAMDPGHRAQYTLNGFRMGKPELTDVHRGLTRTVIGIV